MSLSFTVGPVSEIWHFSIDGKVNWRPIHISAYRFQCHYKLLGLQHASYTIVWGVHGLHPSDSCCRAGVFSLIHKPLLWVNFLVILHIMINIIYHRYIISMIQIYDSGVLILCFWPITFLLMSCFAASVMHSGAWVCWYCIYVSLMCTCLCDWICMLWDEEICTSEIPSLNEQAVKRSVSQEILEIHCDSVEELLSHPGTHQFTAGASRELKNSKWFHLERRSYKSFVVLVIFTSFYKRPNRWTISKLKPISLKYSKANAYILMTCQNRISSINIWLTVISLSEARLCQKWSESRHAFLSVASHWQLYKLYKKRILLSHHSAKTKCYMMDLQ